MGKCFIARVLAIITRKKIVHILHINKTGGTALRNALGKIMITSKYIIIFHGHRMKLRHTRRGEKIVFFVRDPISRFISGFCSRLRQGRPCYNILWNEYETMAFSYFNKPNNLAIALFSEKKELRERAMMVMINMYHIKTFLVDWVGSIDYFRTRRDDILFIGRQEYLNEDFELFKQILGLPKGLKLPRDRVKANISPVSCDNNISPEGASNLKKWYSRDYEFLEVCVELGFLPSDYLGKNKSCHC